MTHKCLYKKIRTDCCGWLPGCC